MKSFLSYSWVILPIFLQSCVLSKNSFDQKNLKQINKHKSSIGELADFSISLLDDKKWLEIHIDTLTNTSIKTKIKSFGKFGAIYVNTSDTFSYGYREPLDSTVTFKRLSFFFGVEEIIYDYSKRNRTFPDYISPTGDYKFLNIDERIYYRRRPFPWM